MYIRTHMRTIAIIFATVGALISGLGCKTSQEQVMYSGAKITNTMAHEAVEDFDVWMGVQRQLIQKEVDAGRIEAAQERERKLRDAETIVREAIDEWNKAVDQWRIAAVSYMDAKDVYNGTTTSGTDLELKRAKLEAARQIADIAMTAVFNITKAYIPTDEPLF